MDDINEKNKLRYNPDIGIVERQPKIWYHLIYVNAAGEKRYKLYYSKQEARNHMFKLLKQGTVAWVEQRITK